MDRKEKGYLTIDEMAEYLSLSPTQVKNLRKAFKDEMFAATLVDKAYRKASCAWKKRKKRK